MTIEDALATIPAHVRAALYFDERPRCYLYPRNAYTISSQISDWISYGDAETMAEAIVKAVTALRERVPAAKPSPQAAIG